jgi:hypothetical protein
VGRQALQPGVIAPFPKTVAKALDGERTAMVVDKEGPPGGRVASRTARSSGVIGSTSLTGLRWPFFTWVK